MSKPVIMVAQRRIFDNMFGDVVTGDIIIGPEGIFQRFGSDFLPFKENPEKTAKFLGVIPRGDRTQLKKFTREEFTAIFSQLRAREVKESKEELQVTSAAVPEAPVTPALPEAHTKKKKKTAGEPLPGATDILDGTQE